MALSHESICFVLVRTQFASNLGSTVRVMKNMGFSRLILVQPECEVGMEARSYAMRGADILDSAEFLPDLETVSRRLAVLIGTTGRFKGSKSNLTTCRKLAEEVLPRFSTSSVGIVFGSENNGLRRDEIPLCQWLVEIPTGSEYPVLNLAQSAAIVAYELNMALSKKSYRGERRLADPQQIDALIARTEASLRNLELPTRIPLQRILQRIRKIAARAQLEKEDVNMLHGILKELQRQRSSR